MNGNIDNQPQKRANRSIRLIVLVAVIALGINAALGFMYTWPSLQEVRHSKEQLATAEARKQAQKAVRLEDIQVVEDEIRSLLARVPLSVAPSSVLQVVGPLAAETGVKLDAISHRGGEANAAQNEAAADLQAIAYDLSISGGSLGKTLQFIYNLQQAVRLMKVKEWSYRQQGVTNDGQPIYGASIAIEAYAMPQYSDQLQLDLPEIKEREAAVQQLMERVTGLVVD